MQRLGGTHYNLPSMQRVGIHYNLPLMQRVGGATPQPAFTAEGRWVHPKPTFNAEMTLDDPCWINWALGTAVQGPQTAGKSQKEICQAIHAPSDITYHINT